MIRALLKRDLSRIQDIHKSFYDKDFPFSELNSFMCSFVSVDENDQVIVAGGIKTIVEAIIVTDKDVGIEKRQKALLEILKTAGIATKDAGYKHLHAFVTDDKWMRHLILHGFQPTAGKSLIIGV